MTPEEKLADLGLTLPTLPAPAFTYVPFKRDGDTVYLSGQGPLKEDGSLYTGKVGLDLDWETAAKHARLIGLQLLSAAKMAADGDLGRVEFLKIFGMVNGVPDFEDQPRVINGCSDVLVEILGERGKHARSAIGMGSLPGGMTVEIEGIIKLH